MILVCVILLFKPFNCFYVSISEDRLSPWPFIFVTTRVQYPTASLYTGGQLVIKINGHEDKRSSKFSNLNSVNSKIAETKQQNRLKQCFSWFWFVLYCCLNLLTVIMWAFLRTVYLRDRLSSWPPVYKLAAGRKLAATHLNVWNTQMCGCTGFKSGSYNKSYYSRPFKNDTGL